MANFTTTLPPFTTTLTRAYYFSASHRLHIDGLSEEENYRIYGKCNNPHGHGHNYRLLVSVQGPVDEQSGLILPVEELDSLVQEAVVRAYDHKDLNTQVPEFADTPSTTERVSEAIATRLERAWAEKFFGIKARLRHIRIEETKRNFIELPMPVEQSAVRT